MITYFMTTYLDEDTIKKDVNEEEESLDEERTIAPQDEDDQDVDDTTPLEAEELADEGAEILEEERKRLEHEEE